MFWGHPYACADRVCGSSQEATSQSSAGRAVGGVCGILFVAQSSGFFDAAGADRRADAVGKLRFAGGQAGRLAMAAQAYGPNFKVLRSSDLAGNATSGTPVAGCLGGLCIRDLPSRWMAGLTAADSCAVRSAESAGDRKST